MTVSAPPASPEDADLARDLHAGLQVLARRPSRAPQHADENRALVALARQAAVAPRGVLQALAETARELCRADAAGISVLEEEAGRPVLRWVALAGAFARHRGRAIPVEGSPGALALRHGPIVVERPTRHFAFLAEHAAHLHEALLVPLPAEGPVAGTLWVLTQDPARAFDREDARLLLSLAQLAAATHRMVSIAEAAEAARHEARALAALLRQREVELRELLALLPVGAYTCDAAGRITFFNRQAAALWGREPRLDDDAERFCGSLRLFANDGTPVSHEACAVAAVLRGEPLAPGGCEVQIERPDGTRIAALAHVTPIRDDDGRVAGAVNVFVDVSDRRRAEEALRTSEQRFARFMHHLPGLAWIKDLGGRYLFVNDAAERAFQRPRVQLYGRTDAELFPASVAAHFAENDRRALATGAGVEAVETLEHADGTHHSLVSKFPIPGPDGRPALVGGIAIDITERLRAEEALRTSERIHRAIGESIDYGVWICDAQGRNVYASESFLRLVGLTQEECSNLGWGSVLHPDDAERTLAAWRECVRTGRQWDVEHRFRGVDGRWHPVLARGVRVENERGETTGWAGINLDIGRLKQVEDELRDADRRKDEFLATLAHELRNPLAPIRHSLAALRFARGRDADAIHERMERQVDQMVRLVDDLLDVSRITRGAIELRRERVELAAVIAAAVETSRPWIAAGCHRLETALPDEPLGLDADAVRLAQVFANLLNNAARYSDERGRIVLAARRAGDEVIVSVRDQGIGIPPERLAEVFDPFAQVDRSRRGAQGGLGIGLAIVRRLVEMHGGRVEAHSEGLGRGSEFRVVLPLAAGPPIPRSTPARVRPARHPHHRVLVVDDNVDAGESLDMLLRLLGVESRVVHDGAAALAAVASFRPTLVLLDLGMPGMDGYEVARRIRAAAGGGGPRLVALTGWGQPEDRRRTRAAGFDHHLVKPASLDALQSVLGPLDAPLAEGA